MRRLTLFVGLAALTLSMGGCDLIGDILEFGFWLALIVIVLVIVVIWLLIRMIRRAGRGTTGPPRT